MNKDAEASGLGSGKMREFSLHCFYFLKGHEPMSAAKQWREEWAQGVLREKDPAWGMEGCTAACIGNVRSSQAAMH